MKTLVYKLIIFSILICIGQILWTYLFPPKTPRVIRMLNQHLANKRDIIYLGDSTVRDFHPQDNNKSTIVEMLQERLASHTVGGVYAAAYNIDLYMEYVKYIAKSSTHPKLIIIPINMHSFSPEWDLRPEYQFAKEKLFLTLARNGPAFILYRPLAILTDLAPIDQQDFLNAWVFDGQNRIGRVKEFEGSDYRVPSEEKIRKKMTIQYMFSVDKNHRKIKSLLETINMLQKSGIKAVFYITPIDYQTGRKYLGDRFSERLTENVRFIKSLFSSKGYPVLDFSMSLEAESFNWGVNLKGDFVYPNEHLKERGRSFVAEQLSRRIEEDLGMARLHNKREINLISAKPGAAAGQVKTPK